jgi:hypothetical protein
MPSLLPSYYYVEIWSAIMNVAVQAYTIKDLDIS